MHTKQSTRSEKELANAIVEFAKEIDYDTAFKMTYNPKTIELIQLADNL